MVNHVTLSDELKKNNELKVEELNKLKDWYQKQPHLPEIPDVTLALFFHSCFYRIEATKTTIDNYFTCRTHVPEFFDNRDPKKVDIRNGKLVVDIAMLPGTTPNGSRVIFMKFAQLATEDFSFTEAIKSFLMSADIEHHSEGTSLGFIILFDMEGISFGHLPKLNILSMKKILYYLQEAMPVRLTGLHFINVVPFMDKILAMMRPFLKKELMDNMKLHMSGIDGVYPYVPKSMLPAEYGGNSPAIPTLRDEAMKLRLSYAQFFIDETKLRVVESKRPGKAKDAGELFGVEGSFKKLELD